jgi:hypothetical protein
METQEQVKDMVRQKYSEIALQDKEPTLLPVVVRVAAVPKYITLWLMITHSWKVITPMRT